ncbi:hypothetical protein [Sporosarcina aquimarina]|uniref:Uncharacterized protein n=1 Tax=Sporosarcina aquimarina TaxID=114975 RepID=A0ABU4G0G0_9BACL|nr:hypothetical protein [Sporosarcina aquimarina]MDW0110446.1 hypothetical protein [Sporosarcina aquimarina]
MTEKERTDALIAYLHALVTVQSGTSVRVFAEIQRVIALLESKLQ